MNEASLSLWEVFIWGFGVLFLSCRVRVCRCRGCCSLSVCVCVCDLLNCLQALLGLSPRDVLDAVAAGKQCGDDPSRLIG